MWSGESKYLDYAGSDMSVEWIRMNLLVRFSKTYSKQDAGQDSDWKDKVDESLRKLGVTNWSEKEKIAPFGGIWYPLLVTSLA